MKIIVELSSFVIGSDVTDDMVLTREFNVAKDTITDDLLVIQADVAAHLEFNHNFDIELYGSSIDFDTESLGFALVNGVENYEELEIVFEELVQLILESLS